MVGVEKEAEEYIDEWYSRILRVKAVFWEEMRPKAFAMRGEGRRHTETMVLYGSHALEFDRRSYYCVCRNRRKKQKIFELLKIHLFIYNVSN